MQGPTIGVQHVARGNARVPFKEIAGALLPERYELSLVLCGDALSRRMNRDYRKKDYVPNVLSFPIEKYEGEIFINIRKAEREARSFGLRKEDRIAHLFAHGCLHLLGMKHGERMERLETRTLKKCGFRTISPTTKVLLAK